MIIRLPVAAWLGWCVAGVECARWPRVARLGPLVGGRWDERGVRLSEPLAGRGAGWTRI